MKYSLNKKQKLTLVVGTLMLGIMGCSTSSKEKPIRIIPTEEELTQNQQMENTTLNSEFEGCIVYQEQYRTKDESGKNWTEWTSNNTCIGIDGEEYEPTTIGNYEIRKVAIGMIQNDLPMSAFVENHPELGIVQDASRVYVFGINDDEESITYDDTDKQSFINEEQIVLQEIEVNKSKQQYLHRKYILEIGENEQKYYRATNVFTTLDNLQNTEQELWLRFDNYSITESLQQELQSTNQEYRK